MADEAEQITVVLTSFDRKVESHGWGAKEEKITQLTSVLAVWRGKIEGIDGTRMSALDGLTTLGENSSTFQGDLSVSRAGDRIQVRVTVPALPYYELRKVGKLVQRNPEPSEVRLIVRLRSVQSHPVDWSRRGYAIWDKHIQFPVHLVATGALLR